MAEQEQDPPVEEVADEEEDNPNYKPPAPKPLNEIVSADADDESLRKYKEALLGNNTKEVVILDESKNSVILKNMALVISGREPIQLDLTQSVEELKKTGFTLKEGCLYKIAITFNVQKEIVSGLRYMHKVYRKGIKVANMMQMMGSYAPSTTPYTFITREEDEAPAGLLFRGDYKIKSKFVDDDGVVFASWELNLAVKKDWE